MESFYFTLLDRSIFVIYLECLRSQYVRGKLIVTQIELGQISNLSKGLIFYLRDSVVAQD